MNIIQRNFFRLLRAGTFQTEELIEPMSTWKWGQAFFWAKKLGVAPLLYDGVEACNDQFFMRLTDELRQQWQQEAEKAERRYHEVCTDVAELLTTLGELQLRPILMEPWTTACLYPTPSRHHAGLVCIYFPFSTQGHKADEWARTNGSNADSPHRHVLQYKWKSLSVEHRHRMLQLSNKLNNLTLHHIIEQEWLDGGTSHVVISGQRIETIAPTLTLLVALVSIIKTMLNEGLCLWQVVDLGMLLRQQGDRVDFVKLQEWTERLHFSRMAQLVGTLLTELLGFSADEVPFMQPTASSIKVESIVAELFSESHSSARFFRYSPGESLSSVVASITHSLGNIEE